MKTPPCVTSHVKVSVNEEEETEAEEDPHTKYHLGIWGLGGIYI